MVKHGFPIAIAARRSGLSQHVIRAWEKRYAAIQPGRSGTQRRLYSDDEIERLQLLRRATQGGHSIGNIASLPTDDLRKLAATDPGPDDSAQPDPADSLRAACMEAIERLDAPGLDRILQTGLATLGRGPLMQRVIVPLITEIGDKWEHGVLRVAHEHCATTVIRTLLGNFVHAHSATSNAPVLIVTTPPGQLHELGALIAAATATDRGWKVLYLGPSLPAEEIAGAFAVSKADALALSIVYPADDPALAAHLRSIRKLLPDAPIIAGGRSAHGYSAALAEIGATVCCSIPEIVRALDTVRSNRLR
jgi:DNA-binding transcriptional MerR regulator/methylmalonyl-CoA mutase cobalamin-binding subunit